VLIEAVPALNVLRELSDQKRVEVVELVVIVPDLMLVKYVVVPI
jgi:hypothetical protein